MSKTGGVAEAAGLEFQYLVSLEVVLDRLEASQSEFVFITEDQSADVIDMALTNPNGDYELVVQAKGAVDISATTPITQNQLWDIVVRLTDVDSAKYLLWTSRPLSKPAVHLLEELRTHARGTTQPLSKDAQERWNDVSTVQRERIGRFDVRVETSTSNEMQNRLKQRVTTLRREHGAGLGDESAHVFLGYLVYSLLDLSRQVDGRCLSRQEILDLLRTSSRTIAHAHGEYDWGEVIGNPPQAMLVEREKLSTDVEMCFLGLPTDRHARKVAITGMSGIGKTSLAAHYLTTHINKYDEILWIDASSDLVLQAFIDDHLPLEGSGGSTKERFRHYLNRSCAYWLIVFDNAPSARALQDWITDIAHVDIIATSIDETGWEQWKQEPIEEMSPEEAIDLIQLRLSLSSLDTMQLEHASMLSKVLDYWPLALELGCAWLKETGRGLDFAEAYVNQITERLAAQKDIIPAPYATHPSLLEAIRFSVDSLYVSDSTAVSPKDLLRALAFLHPEQAPLSLAGKIASEATAKPEPDEFACDDLVRRCARASLLSRTPPRAGIEPCVRTNAVVLDIIRLDMEQAEYAAFCSSAMDVLSMRVEAAIKPLDARQMAFIAPSALYAVMWASPDTTTVRGILMLGNLGTYYSFLSHFDLSRILYERELTWLGIIGQNESPIQAKALFGWVQAVIHLGKLDEIPAIMAAIEKTVDIISRTQVIEQSSEWSDIIEEFGDLLDSMGSMRHLDSDPKFRSVQAKVNKLRVPSSAEFQSFHAIEMLVYDGSTDEAIRAIDQALSASPAPYDEVLWHALKADALASGDEYDEAKAEWDTVIHICDSTDLKLNVVAGILANTWFSVAMKGLIFDHDAGSFSSFLLDRFPLVSLPDGPDAARLLLCRLMSVVLTGSEESVRSAEEDMGNTSLQTSFLIQSAESGNMCLAWCKEIIRLRDTVSWAEIYPLAYWKFCDDVSRVLGVFTLGTSEEARRRLLSQSHSFPEGKWIVSADGVGMAIGSPPHTMLWRWAHVAGLLGGPIAQEVMTLRERISAARWADPSTPPVDPSVLIVDPSTPIVVIDLDPDGASTVTPSSFSDADTLLEKLYAEIPTMYPLGRVYPPEEGAPNWALE